MSIITTEKLPGDGARELRGPLDRPISDAENDAFWGVPLESDDTPNKACAAIREIPQALFSPECAKTILDVLAAKVAASNFSHFKPVEDIVEHLDEASIHLEGLS